MRVAWIVVVTGAAFAARAGEKLTWAEVEPLLRARFAIEQLEGASYTWTSDAPLPDSAPRKLQAALVAVTSPDREKDAVVMQQISLSAQGAVSAAAKQDPLGGDLAADSERFRAALFADARAARILRRAVAAELAKRGLACDDCALPDAAVRKVTFADFVPYLARFAYAGPGDLADASGQVHFHVCSGINGLRHMEHVDSDLAATALSAMFRATKTAAIQRAGETLTAIRAEKPGEETAELRDAVNDELARRLAADEQFLAPLRPLVAEEALASGMTCADCASR